MNDCKIRLSNLPMLSWGEENIPCVGIGTCNISEDALTGLFTSYPYKKIVIDTAYKYGNEKQVCNALRKARICRQDISYIGKISYAQQEEGNVESALECSLKNLNIDFFDMYLIHSPRYKNYCETWKQMISLKERGLIKHIGVSNFGIKEIQSLVDATGVIPSINQVVVTPFLQERYNSLVEYCKEKNILLQVAMPFGGTDNKNSLTDTMRKEILLEWYKKGAISIVGTSKSEHMLKNLAVYSDYIEEEPI